jgi:hypothetical protein
MRGVDCRGDGSIVVVTDVENDHPPARESGPASDGGRPPSGLRDPARAVRGLGAGTLILETVVLLLAVQPIRLLGGDLGGTAIAVVAALAVLAVVLSGLLRRPWAWYAATALQGLLMLAGFLHWSLGVLGILFALVWAYVLHVRQVILG